MWIRQDPQRTASALRVAHGKAHPGIEWANRSGKMAIGIGDPGFQLEGRDREAVCRDGVRYDLLRMGLLASEWRIG